MENMRNVHRILVKTLKGRDHLGGLDVDCKIKMELWEITAERNVSVAFAVLCAPFLNL
jgi:hypothetical protein